MANYKNKKVDNFTQYFRSALQSVMDSCEPPVSATELANMLRITPQSIYRLLKDLQPGEPLASTSDETVRNIGEVLDLPKETVDFLQHQMDLDRIERRMNIVLNVNKTTIPVGVSSAWEKLTAKQRKVVTEIVVDYAAKATVGKPFLC